MNRGRSAQNENKDVALPRLTRTFVAQTKPRKEHLAKTNLERQGFDTFLPLIAKRRNNRLEPSGPLFPGYIFLRFDPASAAWRSVNGTLGVVRLITNGPNEPAVVPKSVMDALIRGCEGDLCPFNGPELHKGQSVRLTEGPFADLVGTIQHLDAQGRVQVLLRILGGSRVTVAASVLDVLAA